MKILLFFFLLSISSIRADWPCPCGQYSILGECQLPKCLNNPILPPCATSCPPGQWPAQHLCMIIPHCPDGHAALYGKCVPQCGLMEYPTHDQCVICPTTQILVDGVCSPCPFGTRPVNNMCQLDCPIGYRLVDGLCKVACPYWQYLSNGTCVNNCLTGWKAYLNSDGNVQCFPSCPQETYTFEEQQCVDVCPAGYRSSLFGKDCVQSWF